MKIETNRILTIVDQPEGNDAMDCTGHQQESRHRERSKKITKGLGRRPNRRPAEISSQSQAPTTSDATPRFYQIPTAEDAGRGCKKSRLIALFDGIESVGDLLVRTLFIAAYKFFGFDQWWSVGYPNRQSEIPREKENLRSANRPDNQGSFRVISAVADARSDGDHREQLLAFDRHDSAIGRHLARRPKTAPSQTAQGSQSRSQGRHLARSRRRHLQILRISDLAEPEPQWSTDRSCRTVARGRRVVFLLWVPDARGSSLSELEAIVVLGEFSLAIGVARPVRRGQRSRLVVLRPRKARRGEAGSASAGFAGTSCLALARTLVKPRQAREWNRFRLAVERTFFSVHLAGHLPRWWGKTQAWLRRTTIHDQALSQDRDDLPQSGRTGHRPVYHRPRGPGERERSPLQQFRAGHDSGAAKVPVPKVIRFDPTHKPAKAVLGRRKGGA